MKFHESSSHRFEQNIECVRRNARVAESDIENAYHQADLYAIIWRACETETDALTAEMEPSFQVLPAAHAFPVDSHLDEVLQFDAGQLRGARELAVHERERGRVVSADNAVEVVLAIEYLVGLGANELVD